MKLCECGCGKEVKTETARFLPGHYYKKKSIDAQKSGKMDIQKAANVAFPEKKKGLSNAWQYILLSICFIVVGVLQTTLLPLLDFVVVYTLDIITFVVCCIWASKLSTQKIVVTTRSEEKKPQSSAWQYILLAICFIIAGVLQTILFKTLIILPLLGFVIVYILDLIIFIICCIWVWRQKKLKEYVLFDSMETFLEEVPRWSIHKPNPKSGLLGSFLNAGKEFKQIVLISKNYEPRMLWAESNGFLFIIDDRAYEMPHEVRGDAFFYDVDKKKCLNDISPATEEDAESSFKSASQWNIAIAIGYQEAMSKSRKEIDLILLLVGVTLAAVVLSEIYNIGQFGALNTKMDAIIKIAQDAAAQVAAGKAS